MRIPPRIPEEAVALYRLEREGDERRATALAVAFGTLIERLEADGDFTDDDVRRTIEMMGPTAWGNDPPWVWQELELRAMRHLHSVVADYVARGSAQTASPPTFEDLALAHSCYAYTSKQFTASATMSTL